MSGEQWVTVAVGLLGLLATLGVATVGRLFDERRQKRELHETRRTRDHEEKMDRLRSLRVERRRAVGEFLADVLSLGLTSANIAEALDETKPGPRLKGSAMRIAAHIHERAARVVAVVEDEALADDILAYSFQLAGYWQAFVVGGKPEEEKASLLDELGALATTLVPRLRAEALK